MGAADILKVNPLQLAFTHVNDGAQKDRQRWAQERVDLYREKNERWLQAVIWKLFAQGRRQKIEPFIQLAAAQSLFRRIIKEVSRPVYSPAPIRTIYSKSATPGKPGKRKPGADNDRFQETARKIRLTRRMALACDLLHAANCVALHPRMNGRLGLVLDVLTPNMFWVIPDPDDPLRELAFIYCYEVQTPNGREIVYVYWDDATAFKFSQRGQVIPNAIATPDGKKVTFLTPADGHPGILPFVVVHAHERFGSEYFDTSTGKALVAAQHSLGVLHALVLRLHKTQGHKQIAVSGELSNDQILDEENPVNLGETGRASVLSDPTDTSHHLKTMDFISLGAAANWGLNRDQMNQLAYELSDSTGLLERRAETITVMREAEERLVEVEKTVTSGYPDWEIPERAQLAIDFAEISAKADRMQQLDIRDREVAQGTRNYLDNILEDNPELSSEEEAEAELQHNLDVNLKWAERFKAMNTAKDNNLGAGQTAEQNGAMGSAVRDGAISKDEAAARAKPRPGAGAYGAQGEQNDGT